MSFKAGRTNPFSSGKVVEFKTSRERNERNWIRETPVIGMNERKWRN